MCDHALREELLALRDDDEATRARLASTGALFVGYNPEMEAVHRRNVLRLRAIVGQRGWPGRSLVGHDGAAAAWLIVQHAIGEPEQMRWFLPIIEGAARAGEADATQLAMLVDRIRVLEGRPQLYGTQYDWSADGRSMVPSGAIEDPDHLATRRAAAGLGAMEWTRVPPADERPPSDQDARRREMAAWARKVGWRP
jgi:uncharacterized protein DUF6624